MKKKKILKYILFILIILISYLFIQCADKIFNYNLVLLDKISGKLFSESFCGKYGCREDDIITQIIWEKFLCGKDGCRARGGIKLYDKYGISLYDHIYREYNDVIDASSGEFSVYSVNFYKFYYDENDENNEYFFSKHKIYSKVSEGDIEEIYSYFNFIYKNYYDEKIFPEGFSIKEVITENDYYFIYDAFHTEGYLYSQYERFNFYYYDIEEHVLYFFVI